MADCPSVKADSPLNKPGKRVRSKEKSEVLQTRLDNPSGAGWTIGSVADHGDSRDFFLGL